MSIACAVALAAWLAAAGPARAEVATADEISRLSGHQVTIRTDGSLEILDIANEGRPLVGVVERSGSRLVLRAGGESVVLRGPLAIPRIAGPGYRIWALGERRGDELVVRRLGVLRAPDASP